MGRKTSGITFSRKNPVFSAACFTELEFKQTSGNFQTETGSQSTYSPTAIKTFMGLINRHSKCPCWDGLSSTFSVEFTGTSAYKMRMAALYFLSISPFMAVTCTWTLAKLSWWALTDERSPVGFIPHTLHVPWTRLLQTGIVGPWAESSCNKLKHCQGTTV